MKCYLKTENSYLKTQTKHFLIILRNEAYFQSKYKSQINS